MSKMSRALVITHWVDATPDVLWNAYSTPELFHQFFSPEGLNIPLESVVIDEEEDGDSFVSLFIILKENIELTEELIIKIKEEIKVNTSPKHIPKKITLVPDIPRTRSGKISELSVKAAINGNEIKNIEALANPNSIDFFKQLRIQN